MKDLKGQFEQYKGLICVLLGAVLCVLSYLYGFNAYRSKTSDVQEEVDVLQAQYAHLEKMNNDKEKYTKDTTEYEQKYESLLKRYDADITYESIIVDTTKAAENADVDLTSLTLTPKEMVYQFGTMTSANPDNAQPTGINSDYMGMKENYEVVVKGDYQGIKEFIEEITQKMATKRKVFTDTAYVFDATEGDITATLKISEYAVAGGERKQQAVSIANMPHGITNIFSNGVLTGNETK